MKKAPFKWHTSWSGIVLSDENLLLPNTWNFVLEYDAVSEDMLYRDVAMQRLEFMIQEKFETSTWLNFENPWSGIMHDNLNTFMITLPGDPYDSLIAATALLKAQSITKGVFDIHGCSIISKLGYNVENVIDIDEAVVINQTINFKNYAGDPWFLREDAGFTDILCMHDNVPTLIKDTEEWSSYNLNWDYYHSDENNPTPIENYKHNQKERWIPLVTKNKPTRRGSNES